MPYCRPAGLDDVVLQLRNPAVDSTIERDREMKRYIFIHLEDYFLVTMPLFADKELFRINTKNAMLPPFNVNASPRYGYRVLQ